jgi:hypothetical protein
VDEGGTGEERTTREGVVRRTWGTVRRMIWVRSLCRGTGLFYARRVNEKLVCFYSLWRRSGVTFTFVPRISLSPIPGFAV